VQTGNNNQGCLLQVGNNLDAQLVQNGGQSVNVLQSNKGAGVVSEMVCTQGAKPTGRMSRLVKIATN
jgi:Curlin associated repeat